MKLKFIFLLLTLSFFLISNNLKCQNSCFYVEEESISKGFVCIQDTLHFTNTVETQIKGEISANKIIIIKPGGAYGIILKPNDEIPCQECVEGEGSTIIKTKDRTGGNKGKKVIGLEITKNPVNKVSLRKNPVKDLLEFYLPENINISSYQIYDSLGKYIKTTIPINKNSQINISQLPSGKYWITIYTNENKTYTLTFIKN